IVRRTLALPVMPGHLVSAALPLALATALIWTVHPLQTEAVTYVIQRTESLMGLFYLLTLYCVIRAAAASRPLWWYVAATAACALGVGCKEAMVTAPLVVLVYDRLFLTRSFKEVLRRRWPLYVGLAATWAILAALVLPLSGRAIDHAGLEYWQATRSYALTQIVAVVRYLGLCFWPRALVMDYGHLLAAEAALSIPHAIILVMLLAAAVAVFFYRPRLGFLGVWFFAILAPSSSIVPLVLQPIAEKRMYLPLAAVVVGVVICAYILVRRLWDKSPAPGRLQKAHATLLGAALTAAVVLLLGFLTVRRNNDYRSPLAIWQDTARKQPNNSRAWGGCATANLNKGNYNQAISHYDRAIELDPTDAETYYFNRADAYRRKHDYDRAIRDYTKAIELNPKLAGAYNNRGHMYRKKGDYDKAISDFTTLIEMNPKVPESYGGRGNAYSSKGEYDKAIRDYTRATELNPKSPGPYNNRAVAHLRKGDYGKAWADVRMCQELGGIVRPSLLDDLVRASWQE
ncbi:MAG: tetratricopeptide repeat protein, partial [Phycisphaerae bacterium]|nr:tetratricopeptide repeat protein [Phycisphaerae bacterium]